jgi:predicted transposase YdaD
VAASHDLLFKKTFSEPAQTASVLAALLPPELSASVDWASLRLEPGSFVEPGLHECLTDLLFRCRWGGMNAHLYVLFEHQSTQEPLMPLRLLEYQTRIWRRDAKLNPAEPLIPILAVVLAQSNGSWKAPVWFSQHFALENLPAGKLPEGHIDFRYHLIDLTQFDYANLKFEPLATVVLRAMKWVREPDTRLATWVRVEFWSAIPTSDRNTVFEYLLRQVQIDTQAIRSQIVEIESQELKFEAMTTYDRILEEGLIQGREEGRREGEATGEAKGRVAGLVEGETHGLRAAILETLELRFDEVPYEVRESLERIADLSRLRILHRLAVTAPSLSAFRSAS